MAADADILTDQQGPWWSRISAVVAITIIALGLVYLVAVRLDSQMKLQAETLSVIKENLILHHNNAERNSSNIEYYMKVQTNLLRLECLKGAKTESEKSACFRE